MLFVFFLGLASYISCKIRSKVWLSAMGFGGAMGLVTNRMSLLEPVWGQQVRLKAWESREPCHPINETTTTTTKQGGEGGEACQETLD